MASLSDSHMDSAAAVSKRFLLITDNDDRSALVLLLPGVDSFIVTKGDF